MLQSGICALEMMEAWRVQDAARLDGAMDRLNGAAVLPALEDERRELLAGIAEELRASLRETNLPEDSATCLRLLRHISRQDLLAAPVPPRIC